MITHDDNRKELVGVKVTDVAVWGALQEIMFLNGM